MLNLRSLKKFSTQALPYSYIHGTSLNPLQYMTVSAKFDQISQKYGDNIALISQHQNKEYKYGELWDEANHIAASLIALGLSPKDRIGLYAPNNAEWYLLQLAASLADLILGFMVPNHTKGELCVRGYSVMQGYWEDSKSTKKMIDSKGWIHSGDLAQMDEVGYVTIVGRSKDMIIRGGENIYPKEIEEFLLHMENVEDVQVFGVSDEKYGEEICAFVRLKNKQKVFNKIEVMDFCKGKISHFKIPKYVRVVDHFPLTVTGKPQKFRMHEEMEHLFKDPRKKEEFRIR